MANRRIPRYKPEGTVDWREACELLGNIPKSTFYRYLKEPDFPAPVHVSEGGRYSLWSKEALLAWYKGRFGQT